MWALGPWSLLTVNKLNNENNCNSVFEKSYEFGWYILAIWLAGNNSHSARNTGHSARNNSHMARKGIV